MQKDNIHILGDFFDKIGTGLLYIDQDRKIQMANYRAKEFTGINVGSLYDHKDGVINPGDIVVIADNCVGDDDGELVTDDLKKINIHNNDIRQGDMLIAIGVYGHSDFKPYYKYLRNDESDRKITIEKGYLGFEIVGIIDKDSKCIKIIVDNREYNLDYLTSIGHMVVIDGQLGEIKFFQSKGYTARKEDIAILLRGGRFTAKEKGENNVDVEGTLFLNLFDESELSEKLFRIIDREEDEYLIGLPKELNKREFICSIIPHSNEETGDMGAFLILEQPDKLENAMQNHEKFLANIKNRNHFAGDFTNYPEDAFNAFVGSSNVAKQVKYLAYKASQNKFNVIITGESGTGKSKIAHEIHKMWNEKAPFVEVNCNSIPVTLFESELFGYVGGAFTGANPNGKMGFFEAANGGTIFLDEVGELPMDIQVKLLHVLQNKSIYRIGSAKPIDVDVRVIVATNRNLEESISMGEFREDLYYRINVFPIEIPPLRDRKQDIYLLINHILTEFCKKYDIPMKQFSEEALEVLEAYDWPGNVRELENIVERAITLCDSKIIYKEHLQIMPTGRGNTLKELLEYEEKKIIENALIKNNGNNNLVMKELGISKTNFYDKIKKYGLN